MQTLRADFGGTSNGWLVIADPKNPNKNIIMIGEEGHGCMYKKIALHDETPAIVVRGKVHHSYLIPIAFTNRKGNRDKFHVASIPVPSPAGKILVMVDSSAFVLGKLWITSKNGKKEPNDGYWSPVYGIVTEISTAWGKKTPEGPTKHAYVILKVEPDAMFLIHFEGGGKEHEVIYHNDKGVLVEVDQATMAIAEEPEQVIETKKQPNKKVVEVTILKDDEASSSEENEEEATDEEFHSPEDLAEIRNFQSKASEGKTDTNIHIDGGPKVSAEPA